MTVAQLLLLLLALALPVLFILANPWRRRSGLPPGPRPWPVVGNLPHLLLRNLVWGQELPAALASIAETHGPLFHLRFGATQLVVASSPSAACQMFKANDRALSERFVPASYLVPHYADHSLIWHPLCDHYWRSLRWLLRAELLSSPSLERSAPPRESKAGDMVRFLLSRQGEEVRVGNVVFTTIFNMVSNILFSRDALSLEEGKGWFPEMKGHMARIVALGGVPNVEDLFPAVTGGLDLQGLRREVLVYVDKVYGMLGEVMQQRREEMEKADGGGAKDDFLKVLLASGLGDTQVKALMVEIFNAASHTTTLLVESTMLELVKNPKVMKRVKDELEDAVGHPSNGNNIIQETQLVHLTYLHACIKETLRLHPPAPLLLPHQAIDACEVMNYTIPKDCAVVVNAWAIGRDPKIWKDPLKFLPERFLDCSVDYKGADFKFIPFGGGRRTCPGMSMAIRKVQLIVASMVHHFNWFLPNGMVPTELKMDEKLGLVLIPRSKMG